MIHKKEDLAHLSYGTLIVRLPKLENNIELIKALEGHAPAQEEIERVNQANMNLIKEFKANYSYSLILFAFEVELYEFLQDPTINVFLGDSLKVDPNIKLKEGPVVILASHRNKIFQLYDCSLRLLEETSPKFTTRYFDRYYEHPYARIAQSISNLLVKNISAAKFNRKLYSILRRNKLRNKFLRP